MARALAQPVSPEVVATIYRQMLFMELHPEVRRLRLWLGVYLKRSVSDREVSSHRDADGIHPAYAYQVVRWQIVANDRQVARWFANPDESDETLREVAEGLALLAAQRVAEWSKASAFWGLLGSERGHS